MEAEQNSLFARIANTANTLFKLLLSPDDMLSLYSAKKLLRSSEFVHANSTAYLSETNAALAIFIAVNLGVLTYQYAYASWFLYLVTSYSGLKKLYHVIFKNQLLGVFYFASFYFKVLEGTADEVKFNIIARKLGLPMHADFVGQKFLTDTVEHLPEKIGNFNVTGYRTVAKTSMKKVAGVVISQQVEGLGVKLGNVLYAVFRTTPEISEMSRAAVYLTNRDIISESEIQEWYDYVLTNKKKIKKELKVRGKKKRQLKLRLQQVIEKKTASGEVICLDECKSKVKTFMGCYCDGDCGKTILIGGYHWCYVDPRKCKKGKYLPTYRGYSYDRCDPSKKAVKCFTGLGYSDCVRRS